MGREGEAKDRAVVRGGFDPDPAAVVLDDALADARPMPGPGYSLRELMATGNLNLLEMTGS